MLTPMEIHSKEFKKSFRGYDDAEVDAFLDQVVGDFERLIKENENLQNRVSSMEKELEQYRRLEHDLQDTITIAQKTAEEVTASAKQQADALRENIDVECKNIRRRAELEARRLLDSTAIDVKNKMAEADTELKSMRTEYESLVREKTQLLLRIRSTFETELAILNQNVLDLPKADNIESKFSMKPDESKQDKPAEQPEPEDDEAEDEPDENADDTKVISASFLKKKIKKSRA